MGAKTIGNSMQMEMLNGEWVNTEGIKTGFLTERVRY